MQVSNLSDEVEQEAPKVESKKPAPSLSELSFVRLIDPIHIPSYLVEQIKDRSFEVEKFYEFQKVACLYASSNGVQMNEVNMLYALVHERLRQVKGFLWMTADCLNNWLQVNCFSVDKEYWNRGQAIDLLDEKAKKIMHDLNFSRIVWITKNPKFCENKGFKRSKETIMVYEE